VSRVESECKPSSGSARRNLGVSLDRLGRKEESEDAFKKALEIAPGYLSAMRSHAAWALGCCPGCDALRALAAASKDPVPEVREMAVESLGRLVPDTDDPVSRITAACGSAPPDEP
jgi:Flp pilus assembly protein TadD